jgi:hypothetical protein
MFDPAPVAVFAYNRPAHLKNLLESLNTNRFAEATSVTVFLDGPRNDFDRDRQLEILEFLKGQFSFKSLHTVISAENKGLANSIRFGVARMLGEYPRVIVLEDDLLLSPSFLEFMNFGLERYETHAEVASIHGFQYPIKNEFCTPVFFRGADCWGWATWRDRWEQVSFDSQMLLDRIRTSGLIESFNLDGNMDFYGMLQKQANGEVDSWAICWHASMYLQKKLTLFPPASLVQNNGNDGSGVHSGVNNFFETELAGFSEFEFPDVIEESLIFRNLLGEFYRKSLGKKSLAFRIMRKLNNKFGMKIV